MSRFWPHPPYAEDQPLSHTILYVHVLTRGLQTGALLGLGASSLTLPLRRIPSLAPRLSTRPAAMLLLRGSGVGGVVGVGAMAAMMPFYMKGKEEIEWQDRSWRLLENKGQVECDDWTYAGILVGAGAALRRGRIGGWRGAVGGVGLGSLGGMMGYMGWRFGVKGGRDQEQVI
ncbi:hypothetical protein B0O99DRAFT_663872 [Bisporella sp. PMI_857]|nr:hypothetical protein B0O99DRAFT_663872 [Bisporella sp. PMI_857]